MAVVIQCKMCNKPFQSFGGKICTGCLTQIDEDFKVVRDYIDDNPYAQIDTVCEDTGVQRKIILHLLRDGRLRFDKSEGGGALFCEICKKPIGSGKMCDDCKNSLAATMSKSIGARIIPPQADKKDIRASKHNARMHTGR